MVTRAPRGFSFFFRFSTEYRRAVKVPADLNRSGCFFSFSQCSAFKPLTTRNVLDKIRFPMKFVRPRGTEMFGTLTVHRGVSRKPTYGFALSKVPGGGGVGRGGSSVVRPHMIGIPRTVRIIRITTGLAGS